MENPVANVGVSGIIVVATFLIFGFVALAYQGWYRRRHGTGAFDFALRTSSPLTLDRRSQPGSRRKKDKKSLDKDIVHGFDTFVWKKEYNSPRGNEKEIENLLTNTSTDLKEKQILNDNLKENNIMNTLSSNELPILNTDQFQLSEKSPGNTSPSYPNSIRKVPITSPSSLHIEQFINSSQDICSICLGDFEPNEILRRLPCKHYYHFDCIDPWLLTQSTECPLCKTDFSLYSKHDINEQGSSHNQFNNLNIFENNSSSNNTLNEIIIFIPEAPQRTAQVSRRTRTRRFLPNFYWNRFSRLRDSNVSNTE